MKYNYQIGTSSPDLQHKMKTKQFAMSEILLDKRFGLNLTFDQMTEITELEPELYIQLEYGDPLDLKIYEEALQKIEEYENRGGGMNDT